jgi:hypothetical protein
MAPSARTEYPEPESTIQNGGSVAKQGLSGTVQALDLKSPEVMSVKEVPRSVPYEILEEPSRIGRRLKVVTIGAGASALNFAHDMTTSKLGIELVCYEKNPEIGGTWFENRYPGCACDIPSVNYQFSWAPRVWSK